MQTAVARREAGSREAGSSEASRRATCSVSARALAACAAPAWLDSGRAPEEADLRPAAVIRAAAVGRARCCVSGSCD